MKKSVNRQSSSSVTDFSDAKADFPDLLNRELSWLEFNRRVLHEALDARTPLLERVKFLEIFTSNLDEFIMKRVGGLKRQVLAGVVTRTPDGMTVPQQLTAIRGAILPMLKDQAKAYSEQIRPALAQKGICLLNWADLSEAERATAEQYFHTNVFPVLTPLAVDPGHPFPFISNLSTSLGVTLRHGDREEKLFARIKIPEVLPRWVRLFEDRKKGQFHFVSLIDLIQHNLSGLFPNMIVIDCMPFRVTRNADVERDEEDAEDLLVMIEQELRERRFASAVRLEHLSSPDPWMLQFLKQELELTDEDVYEMPAELDFTSLKVISDLNLPELKYEPWTPCVPPFLAEETTDIFSHIRGQDVLLHHPYESFAAGVERFIREAAMDPKVLAIKMTVYRTGQDSPFMNILTRAAEAGKQVVCLVELKARFDEQRNILWAQALEKAGVHVVYGIVGLKTHTKMALVVRQEADGVRCYAHIGTGNYHVQTAKLYTDLSLLTARPEITDEVVELFNYLTGRSMKRQYEKLLVAPVNMKERFVGMIEREAEHKKAGRPAHIIAKMNSLEMKSICRALYDASQTGLDIDLIVRGFCCLKPGVKGLSETIRVMSVIGRFLEHSRIFYFRNGAADPVDGEFYIGSADWMYRNLLARVEVITPILDRALRERLWEIIQIMQNDKRQAWDMRADGTYTQRTPPMGATGPEAIGTHKTTIDLTRARCKIV
jgi:polyphosphate kinase